MLLVIRGRRGNVIFECNKSEIYHSQLLEHPYSQVFHLVASVTDQLANCVRLLASDTRAWARKISK